MSNGRHRYLTHADLSWWAMAMVRQIPTQCISAVVDSQPISRLTDTITRYQTLLTISKSKTYDPRLVCVGQHPSLQLAALLLLVLRLALRLLFRLQHPYQLPFKPPFQLPCFLHFTSPPPLCRTIPTIPTSFLTTLVPFPIHNTNLWEALTHTTHPFPCQRLSTIANTTAPNQKKCRPSTPWSPIGW